MPLFRQKFISPIPEKDEEGRKIGIPESFKRFFFDPFKHFFPGYEKPPSEDEVFLKKKEQLKEEPTFRITAKEPIPTPTPKVLSFSTEEPAFSPDTSDIEQKIREGLIKYGGKNLPALQYIPQMVEATKKYPFLKANPFLLPQIMILETSGGRNITRPNNLLNWGITIPENNQIFARMSPEEVLEKAISGLGERSPYYKKFRTGKKLSSKELEEFARTYEPANLDYGHNLREGIRVFENL